MIFSACELGVFDLLAQSQKPLRAETVAQELAISADGAERLLDALVGIGLLEVEAAEDKGELIYSCLVRCHSELSITPSLNDKRFGEALWAKNAFAVQFST